MGTTRKLEQLICQALDEMGYCRFILKKCEDVKHEDCPNVRALTELH